MTPRRFARTALSAALLAVVPVSSAAAAARPSPCAGADRDPAFATVAQLRHSTVCLLNVERRARSEEPLRQNGGLALAGQRHARDMIRRRYFSHVSPGGRPFQARIASAGYLGRAHHAVVGENLAWIAERPATPRAIVRNWMNSPPHRANILHAAFRDVGIGVERAVPASGLNGATYAAEFGRRAV